MQVSYKHPIAGFDSRSSYMTNYYGSVKKRTISTNETYDENGKLISKETVEEIEYVTNPGSVWPNGQWWQNPVTYSSSTKGQYIDPDLI